MKVEPLNGLATEVYRILIVDDSDIDFDRLEDLLECTRFHLPTSAEEVTPRLFRPSRAHTLEDASLQLRNPATIFDAILVSYRVTKSGEDGKISSVVGVAGAAPVLLLTSLGDREEDVRQCLQDGVIEHFSKARTFYEGHDFLVNSILKAIAIKQGFLLAEQSQRESIVEEISQRIVKASRVVRAILIVTIAGGIFVIQPSISRGHLHIQMDDEWRYRLLGFVAPIIWVAGVQPNKDPTPMKFIRRLGKRDPKKRKK